MYNHILNFLIQSETKSCGVSSVIHIISLFPLYLHS